VYPVDIVTSYIVCGAASLLAVPLLLRARAENADLQATLRIAALGFGLIGIGLGQLIFSDSPPSHAAMLIGAVGTNASGPVLALALAQLARARWLTPLFAATGIVVSTMALAIAHVAGDVWFGRIYAALGVMNALLLVSVVWNFLLQPRLWSERIAGVALLLYLASWVLRFVETLRYEGPPLAHLLYVPVYQQPLFGMLYAILPQLMSTLILNIINARLSSRLHTMATTDELTGLLARNAMREVADGLLARRAYSQQELAVLMLDLDHFKAINDKHGHAAGDAVLQHAAAALRAAVRADTWVGRQGGEEFVVLLRVANLETAHAVAERLRVTLAKTPCALAGTGPIAITASFGVALVAAGESFDAALKRADEALYRAKREGRNRVEVSFAEEQLA
jgi:diguanylate cyclase (GGDEF)-like protein